MRYFSWIILVGVLALLVFLGSLQPYREHLLYDVSVYYLRSLYFFENGRLTDVPNEYLPVAATYFITYSPTFFYSNSLEIFEKVFALGNCLLLVVLGWIIQKSHGNLAFLLYSLLLLCVGPIVLYRFEVLVILAMILAISRFRKNDFTGSAMMLAVGTMTKLYPVLLLPYFIILAFKQRGVRSALTYLGTFIITAAGVTLFYFFTTQTSLNELVFSVDFHKEKPVGLESPMAAAHHLVNYFNTGLGAPIVARHNTWGVDDAYLLLPMPILTYLWIVPVGLMYGWLIFNKTKQASFLFVITFLSNFFIFSKLFTPQYWLWVLLLLPFIISRSKKYWGLVTLAALATLLTQFIYPLHYFDFLGYFYSRNINFEYLFWIYLLEILCMVLTAGLATKLYLDKIKIKNLSKF
jgi:hypothetical protein